MMKRLLVAFIAVFYLAIASGTGVHLHYCMGQLVNWSLIEDQSDACGFCGMEKKQTGEKSCCQDVHYEADVDKAQNSTVNSYKFEQLASAILQPVPPEMSPSSSVWVDALSLVYSNAPPSGQQIPVFIKNCTCRI
ncbi:HYC_CC_PP family protein [Sphingobacterium spiritivorum]|uniref:HYC_CC_PP family protein n=1 Tax=Sphingobacterium spiritivorum TaxID=258 RepID=UPI003DA3199D